MIFDLKKCKNKENRKVLLCCFIIQAPQIMKNVKHTDDFWPHEMQKQRKSLDFILFFHHTSSTKIQKNVMRTDDFWPHEMQKQRKAIDFMLFFHHTSSPNTKTCNAYWWFLTSWNLRKHTKLNTGWLRKLWKNQRARKDVNSPWLRKRWKTWGNIKMRAPDDWEHYEKSKEI